MALPLAGSPINVAVSSLISFSNCSSDTSCLGTFLSQLTIKKNKIRTKQYLCIVWKEKLRDFVDWNQFTPPHFLKKGEVTSW